MDDFEEKNTGLEAEDISDEEMEALMREFSEPPEGDPALRTPVLRGQAPAEDDLPERTIPEKPDEPEAIQVEENTPKWKIQDWEVEEGRFSERIIHLNVEGPAESVKASGLPRLEIKKEHRKEERRGPSRVRTMPRMDRPQDEEKKEGSFEAVAREMPPEKPAPKPPKIRKTPRKAILTPEARWKQASERQGSRNVRLAVSAVLTFGGLFLGFVRTQGLLDGYPHQDLFGIGEIALLFMCVLCAYDVMLDGVERMLKPGFGLSSLLLLEAMASLGEGLLAIPAQRASLAPLTCLLLTFALWGKRAAVQAEIDTMDAARKMPVRPGALVREPGYFKTGGVIHTGIIRGEGKISEFLTDSDKPVKPELALNIYAGVVVIAGLAVASLFCDGDVDAFFRALAATMLAGTPLMSFLAWPRPWAILARRLQTMGAAVYGWPGIRRLCGKVMVPVSQTDLFPQGTVKMNGVKFFNGATPDRVVAYAAAVTAAAGSALAPLFEEQLQLRAARRYSVSILHRYDVGGIGAEIGDDSVLVGSLRFMQSVGVEMPGSTKVNQAVYVAIDNRLVGVFALHYAVDKKAVDLIALLCGARGVRPVITARDFIITPQFLHNKFGLTSDRVNVPSMTTRAKLDDHAPGEKAQPAVLCKRQDFRLTVTAVSGARALHTAYIVGIVLTMISGIMGMVMMGVLANLAAYGIMTVVNLTLYLLVWLVPMFILSGWPKNL